MPGTDGSSSLASPAARTRPGPRRVGQGPCTGTRWLPGKIIFIPNGPCLCPSAYATANPGWRISGTSLAPKL